MNRGEIWYIDLNPTIGAEIRKIRPCLIVSDDNIGILPIKVIVPITDWKPAFAVSPWHIKVMNDINNGLNKVSAIDCLQIRSLDTGRFVKKIGVLPVPTLHLVEQSIRLVLHL